MVSLLRSHCHSASLTFILSWCCSTISRVLRRTRSSSARSTYTCRTSSASDRKSTRLNSSHANISYAVFCLKKNNNEMSLPARAVRAYLGEQPEHLVLALPQPTTGTFRRGSTGRAHDCIPVPPLHWMKTTA